MNYFYNQKFISIFKKGKNIWAKKPHNAQNKDFHSHSCSGQWVYKHDLWGLAPATGASNLVLGIKAEKIVQVRFPHHKLGRRVMWKTSPCGTTRDWSAEECEGGREEKRDAPAVFWRASWKRWLLPPINFLQLLSLQAAAISFRDQRVAYEKWLFLQCPPCKGLKALRTAGSAFPTGTLEPADSAEPHLNLKHSLVGTPAFRVSI